MGRSYPRELRQIPETIDWALRQDIAALHWDVTLSYMY